ncbi:MAG: hypothetical protein ACYDD7_21965, partial [Acidimicrobiales bacterium]
PATDYTVSAPSAATTNSPFSFSVTALDASNAIATGYTGTVHFISSDAMAVLPPNSTLNNGVGSFMATLKTVGNQTITGTDTVTSSITGTSGPISVTAPSPVHFVVSAPSTVTRSQAFTFTVTAKNASNVTVTSYAGTVHFSSSDNGIGVHLPPDSTLSSGTGTFSATLVTSGSQTLTATDTFDSSITGSATITVSGGFSPAQTSNRSAYMTSWWS